MSLPERIAHYRIASLLGEGGMGAVYRATDTKLGRDVAIKVLPESFAADPERLARFTREAQVLASLNHPNIATIYGVEERALILELIEGTPAAGPLPVQGLIPLVRQLIDALEAAHEKGIIHRDLKPANVMLTADGAVKVLDFGLAKAMTGDQPAAGSNTANSPTMTMNATMAGMIMGTAAYMAPEQARGGRVDHRADIWAFGVVLFELATGRPLFSGESVSDILAAVLRAELPIDEAPAELRGLLRRCLERDVRKRLGWIGEARGLLDESPAPAPVPATQPVRRAWLPWMVAAGVTAAALAYVGLSKAPPAEPVWLSIVPGSDMTSFGNSLAVSPDGRKVAFGATVGGKRAIWLRPLDSPQMQMIPGTEGGEEPFWSPDGRQIAFHAAGRLQKIAVSAGVPVPLCEAPVVRGGSWSQDNLILFGAGSDGIRSVAASGGSSQAVTKLDTGKGESAHRYPMFLPDGKRFLYLSRLQDPVLSRVYLGELGSSAPPRVVLQVPGKALVRDPNHILYVRDGNLFAQSFDAAAGQVSGEPIPVAQGVESSPVGVLANFDAAGSGTLAFGTGSHILSRLQWFDRKGTVTGTVGAPGALEGFAISPDGSSVAVSKTDGTSGRHDIWLHDLRRGTETRLTTDGNNRFPLWTVDGKRLIFSSSDGGTRELASVVVDGSRQRETILSNSNLGPTGWSGGGEKLLLSSSSNTQGTGIDLWILPMSGDRRPSVLLQTPHTEGWASISPDGRWMLYRSDESGREEVYVTPFPVLGAKWQVSTQGGTMPCWTPDGKEVLFYSGQSIMSAAVKPGASFQTEAPKRLFDIPLSLRNNRLHVAPDGRLLLRVGVSQEVAPISVILNWQRLLPRP